MPGTVAIGLSIIGDRWSLLILREVFHGVRRFDEMQRNLGISRAVLAARLRRLVDAGLLRRTPYREGNARSRDEYRPTRAGVELLPALVSLMEWGERHLEDGAETADALTHESCGGRVHAGLVCDDCGQIIDPHESKPHRARPPAERTGGSADPRWPVSDLSDPAAAQLRADRASEERRGPDRVGE
jgi:DNA-binding HxlR family transcriptional regulator